MTYTVKEIFYTLQGEGGQSGRPAVFCRFAGCNLWSGRESDRTTAICPFCDTDFVGTHGPGGGKFRSATALAQAIATQWPVTDLPRARPYVVCTGGEPLLQLDESLIEALHERDFEVAVETNGTLAPPPDLDWLCVSPKAAASLAVRHGQELKLVYPQVEAEAQPERFVDLDFQHFFLQPLNSPHLQENTQAALRYCLTHPQWRLSLQTHKLLNIP
jgi:7-carboxy-7-deazaguanine synthase (Cx14CxxC type)